MDIEKLGGDLKTKFAAFKTQRDAASDELQRVRADIDNLQSEALRIRKAPVSAHDFCDAMDALITRYADVARKRVDTIVSEGFKPPKPALVVKNPDGTHYTVDSAPRIPVYPCVLYPAMLAWDNVRACIEGAEGCFGNLEQSFPTIGDPRGSDGDGFDFASLCLLLEHPLKEGLRNAYGATTKWPVTEAMSTPDREKRLAEIDAALKPLFDREQQPVDMLAASAGSFEPAEE